MVSLSRSPVSDMSHLAVPIPTFSLQHAAKPSSSAVVYVGTAQMLFQLCCCVPSGRLIAFGSMNSCHLYVMLVVKLMCCVDYESVGEIRDKPYIL